MYRPEWVNTLRRKYFTRTLSLFILHGNTADFVRTETENAGVRYPKFKEYLTHELFKRRQIVVTYDRAGGVHFRDPDVKKDFVTIFLPNYDALHGTGYSKSFPGDPTLVFSVLENYFMNRLSQGKSVGFIVDYAETLIPMNSGAFAPPQDRALLVFLQRWAKDNLFLASDMTTILLTENINDLNQSLVKSPYTCEIEVQYPDETERHSYIEFFAVQKPTVRERLQMSLPVLAKNTAGLNLVQLQTMLAEISDNDQPFTHEMLSERKKAVIESEAAGLLEFVETKYNLDSVAGHAAAKNHLRSAAKALQSGRQDVMPMGYLVNGPVGTGKTFLVSCFAADIGVPMVSLKNFRSQWQGVTESNLEKVLKLLKAMSPVAVMIDEADAYLGNRNQSGDSGVSSRVFSMIASFMSDTENRGQIIWFLLTARPDLMPIDLKRQGRAEEHIALFYPETVEEKKELLAVMLKKTKIKNLTVADFPDDFYQNLTILSGADMEAALTRAKFKAAAQGAAEITAEIVLQTFEDFLPPSYPEEVELMTYVAILECTSKELLPERYRHLTREEVIARIRQIKGRMSGLHIGGE